jgi:hypothetical protein
VRLEMFKVLGFFFFFFKVYQHTGIFGAGRVPAQKNLLNPRPEPTRPGFVIFNPNPRKKA